MRAFLFVGCQTVFSGWNFNPVHSNNLENFDVMFQYKGQLKHYLGIDHKSKCIGDVAFESWNDVGEKSLVGTLPALEDA